MIDYLVNGNWENQYSVLGQYERDNSVSVLREVCTRSSLFNQRENLFEFYRAALQSEAWEEDDPRTKSDRLFFYSTTLLLLEAAYRIAELTEKQELIFLYAREQDHVEALKPEMADGT